MVDYGDEPTLEAFIKRTAERLERIERASADGITIGQWVIKAEGASLVAVNRATGASKVIAP
jgi:hypothetical protein